MQSITQLWQKNTTYTANGILLSDEFYSVVPERQRSDAEFNLTGVLQDSQYLKDRKLASIFPLCEVTKSGYTAIGGEGSMGSDGFVALLRSSDQAPKWIAFFDFSNPFEAIEIQGDQILATSSLGEQWAIPINQPWVIKIRSLQNPV